MGVHFAMFLFTALLMMAWPFAAQAKMFADCTFGKMNTTEGQKMTATFTGRLAAFKHISHSCFVKTDGQNHQNHFLQVKAKRNKESKGFLHVSAYGTDESRILGHLDVSTSETDWSSLTVCPSRYSNEVQEKHLTFSGTPDLSFTVQIDCSPREIKLNEPQTVQVTPENVQVFQFFPTEDIAKTQLDVTVTSESADVPAYLKVSCDCQDVKDNIDVVDYKGESLRLSFAKKGRITLSKVSVPPLTDSNSSWFIGVAIKNASGDTAANATKNVTLELNKSFDYSYTLPVTVLSITSVFLGLLVSGFAVYCFNKKSSSEDTEIELRPALDELEQGNQSSSNQPDTESPKTSGSNRLEGGQQPSSSNAAETKSRLTHGSTRVKSSRRNRTGHIELLSHQGDDEQLTGSAESVRDRAISNNGSETESLLSQQDKNTCCHKVLISWFTRGPKTYSYTTAIVGFVLMIGAGQFVFANWHLMKEEGDRDNCYYNDLCYRVSPWNDIPFNLMISNLVYIIHGLILAGFVCYMETKLLGQYRKRAQGHSRGNFNRPHGMSANHEDLPPKQAFSIGYAFAWALIFEGLFSLVYHLCPSKLTFQFDTAFMFVIAGLIVILLYNGIEMKEYSADDKTAKSPVGATNFFLYFLVPLYALNYLGTLRHSETGLTTLVEIVFLVFLVGWWVIISVWTGFKLFPTARCSKECITTKLCKSFGFALGVGAPVFCVLFYWENLPQAFLFACIAESVITILCTCCCQSIKCNCSCLSCFQVLYVVVMGGLGGLAVHYFWEKQTTDKVETPEKSRNLNQECAYLGFFDYHDMWHFLSSHALLMMMYLVMFMSYE